MGLHLAVSDADSPFLGAFLFLFLLPFPLPCSAEVSSATWPVPDTKLGRQQGAICTPIYGWDCPFMYLGHNFWFHQDHKCIKICLRPTRTPTR